MNETKPDKSGLLTVWLCEYLAHFNGNLDYHKLPKFRQETYKGMAAEIIARTASILDAECQERVLRIVKEIEDKGLFKNPEHILLSGKEWQSLKKREVILISRA